MSFARYIDSLDSPSDMPDSADALPNSPCTSMTGNLGECHSLNLAALMEKLEQVEHYPRQLPIYNPDIVSEHDEYCALNEDSLVASTFPNPGSIHLAPTWSNREIKKAPSSASYILHFPQRQSPPARLQAGDHTVFPSTSGSTLSLSEEAAQQRMVRIGPVPSCVVPDPSDHPILSLHDEEHERLLFHTESSRRASLLYYPAIPPEKTRMRLMIDPGRKIHCPIADCSAAIVPFIEFVREHLVCDHPRVYSLPSRFFSEYLRCNCGVFIWGGGEALALHIASSHVHSRKVMCVHCDWKGTQGLFARHLPLCSGLYFGGIVASEKDDHQG
ncbi:hypothetical protein J3R30DRAFT_1091428 [Lentinula aciculospora]|uniref:Uncharacterized protein n=1 Tax=Lentinula aciculospora TaxID=153920 RepID=A0A9W9A0D1_9AGAR|nr:hypothetical protein J3R30DRAFT_1091428 [Lentinula aciculospora]